MFKKTISKAVIGCAAAILLNGAAMAATSSCVGGDYNLTGMVSGATDCLILNPLNGQVNDSVNPPASTYTVNTESFFGISNWSFDGKYDPSGEGDSSTLFDFSGNSTSGTYSFAGSNTYSNLMFVFKDGADTNLVAYLLSAGSGTYSTPFTSPPFDLAGNSVAHQISHISVYYTLGEGGGGTGEVPEPTTVALLGLGLFGFAASRRKSAKTKNA